MKRTMLIAGLVVASFCSGAFSMNGKAVTVVTTCRNDFWNALPDPRSSLIVVTVNTPSTGPTVVTRTDTLLKEGVLTHPTWSFDGARIAFYRAGHGISIMDADGRNLRDVWKGNVFGAENDQAAISWPAIDGGKWIYFHSAEEDRNTSGQIWRVNINDTTQKSMVFDYVYQGCEGIGACLRRWCMTADAKYAAIHSYGNGNVVPHLFPPQGIAMNTAPSCVSGQNCDLWGTCNPAISPSGNILYHFSGAHTAIYANWWNHTPTSTSPNTITASYTIGTGYQNSLGQWEDIDNWLAPSAAKDQMACFIWPRGAANSDKIVTTVCGNRYGAEYWHNSWGGNTLVANWKDHKAVFVTNNPAPSVMPPPNGEVFRIAEPCHFFVTGGPAGCYEDINGRWIDALTGEVKSATVVEHSARLTHASTVRSTVDVYSLNGARIGTFNASRLPAHLRGAYVVTGKGTASARVNVAQR